MDLIHTTMGLKQQTEQMKCTNCNRGNLKFKSAEYSNDFNDKKGDIIIIDAVCRFCAVGSHATVNVF
ncbi:hypothetical protein JSQ81_07625 [Sporosarcina sp. Marseille-Q4063]|uniref:hypothetical protein n=1 Tax=Sporosarcina sp. Marseille-Q4063 TaxID=2810514 RepID=UPI001BAFB2A1|nr:hypothetical protein [Sporosarcina sp. Marseille-Q4063]QUW20915.1 hypothetical protein JSQ81_13960 [Sporosarcina sp. Marseille-Q4063]QUW23383.1 hypothetical protein JSQ81_07625 [Sporosarcina sp. Marseille-Q4063]